MRIVNFQAIVLRWPEPNDFNNERMTVLLRVDTDAGINGWGEAIAMWPEACRATVAIIIDGFLPLLRGRDPTDIEACWEAMKAHSWWYGEGGIAALAISAVDMALWDIAAKDRGVPLYRLLGGAAHASLPACASLHVNHPTIEDSVAAIEGYIDGGFRSAKLGLAKRGLSKAGRDPDYDVALVGALRGAIGPEPDIMVDAGNGVKWDVETAVSTTRRMEEFGIEWMEEPLHPSDVAGHQALKARTSTLDRRRRARMGPRRLRPLDRERRHRRFRHRSRPRRGGDGLPADRRARPCRRQDRQRPRLEHGRADRREPAPLDRLAGGHPLRAEADPGPDAVRSRRRALLA